MTDAPTTEKGEVGDLFRTVEMGLDARQFLDSRIGRHIAQRALDEMYAWLDPRHAWLVVPAEDAPAATRLAGKALTPWGVRAD